MDAYQRAMAGSAPASPRAQAPPAQSPAASRRSSVSGGGSSSLPTWLWVPNLIGYARVCLLVGAAVVAQHRPYVSMVCYMSSMMLDAFDGMAARALGQSSRFGAVLDMATDRVTTLVLTSLIGAVLLPQYLLAFTFLGVLDIFSHWVLMYKSLIFGAGSHKTMNAQQNILMRIYYTVPYAMFVTCVCAEAFYVSLFMLCSAPADWHVSIPLLDRPMSFFAVTLYLSTPLFVFKQIVNVIQMVEAFADLGRYDFEQRAKQA